MQSKDWTTPLTEAVTRYMSEKFLEKEMTEARISAVFRAAHRAMYEACNEEIDRIKKAGE